MTVPIIDVGNVSKRYVLGSSSRSYGTLRDVMTESLQLVSRIARGQAQPPGRSLWALRDVSFRVDQGEVVGVIGRNGSGKSTLLKLLAHITDPTEGRIWISGRLASLLEVGTGFHMELTGRENIYLSAAILGMTRREIRKRFEDIVAFSEIEEFLDTPVKQYSSGMQARLGFAVAAHLDPDILLVDEVLAVGDAAFQAKCLIRMNDIGSEGRTVLFVSHNMGAITKLCSRAIWLDSGRLMADGPTHEVVAQYLFRRAGQRRRWVRPQEDATIKDFCLREVCVQDSSGEEAGVIAFDKGFLVSIEYEIQRQLPRLAVEFWLTAADGTVVLTSWDTDDTTISAQPRSPGRYRSVCCVPGHLLRPGIYALTCDGVVPGVRALDRREDLVTVEIGQEGLDAPPNRGGVVLPCFAWNLERLAAEGRP
jgi:lipopolysaccharide transport system ATP-binding protein